MAEITVNQTDDDQNEEEAVAGADETATVAGYSVRTEEDPDDGLKRKKAEEELAGNEDDTPEDFYSQYLELAASYAVMLGGQSDNPLAPGKFLDPAIAREAGDLSLKTSRKFNGGNPEIVARIADKSTGKENYYHFAKDRVLADVGAPGINMTVEQAFLVTSATHANESLRDKKLRTTGNEYNRYLLVRLGEEPQMFQADKKLKIAGARSIKSQTPPEIRAAVERDIAAYKALKALDNEPARKTEIKKFSDDIEANKEKIAKKLDRMRQEEDAHRTANAEAQQRMAEQAMQADQGEGTEKVAARATKQRETVEDDVKTQDRATTKTAVEPFKGALATGTAVAAADAAFGETGDHEDAEAKADASSDVTATVSSGDGPILIESVKAVSAGDGATLSGGLVEPPSAGSDLTFLPAPMEGTETAEVGDEVVDDETVGEGVGDSHGESETEDLEGSYADLVEGTDADEVKASDKVEVGRTEAKGDFGASADGEFEVLTDADVAAFEGDGHETVDHGELDGSNKDNPSGPAKIKI